MELVIAWMKWWKPYWAKVDMSKKQTSKILADKVANLVNAMNRMELDSYSMFIKED